MALPDGRGTKNAVRPLYEALRQEAGDPLRLTVVSPGFVRTNLSDSMRHVPEVTAKIHAQSGKMAIAPDAIARAPSLSSRQWRWMWES